MASQLQPLYTPEERLRRDRSKWTLVQGSPGACAISGVFNQSLSCSAISIHG
jgi:hypothetical protein